MLAFLCSASNGLILPGTPHHAHHSAALALPVIRFLILLPITLYT